MVLSDFYFLEKRLVPSDSGFYMAQHLSRYFFLEEWRSREDLDIHIASDYIQSLFGNIQSLIESSDIVEIKKI